MRNAVFTTSLLSLATLGLLAGCPDRTISEVNPQQGRVEYKDIPVTVNRDIDILFIIDDSPSMLDKQNNLKSNFPNFINVLNTIEGGLPNVHIGVVSSDLGTKAADGTTAQPVGSPGSQGSCASGGKNGNLVTSASVQGAFISDTKNNDGTRNINYTGTLAAAFSSLASVGASGCGFEQHIEAAKRAVSNNPANTGFIRQNAYLALIFIQDEDDCSIAKTTLLGSDTTALGPLQSFRCNRFGHVCTGGGADANAMNNTGVKTGCSSNESGTYLTKVADYITFFKGLKTDPANVIVAGIMGPAESTNGQGRGETVELRAPPNSTNQIPAVAHSCTYQGTPTPQNPTGTEVADPSIRMLQLFDGFPNRSTFNTICQQDLSGALTQIAQLLRTVLGSPCIEGKLADVDPDTAGDQYDCSVSDVSNFGKANQSETVLPPCNEAVSNKPCWRIIPKPMQCMVAPNLSLVVERTEAPAADTHVIAYCVTEGE